MNKSGIQKAQLMIGLLIVLALIVRATLIHYLSEAGADWAVYQRFAVNIFNGNGFSLSDSGASVIVPSSGGYYPGFPAFVALAWILFGEQSVNAVLWGQLVLYLVALYWLLNSLLNLTQNINIVIGSGILFALSPLTVGWSRFPLTETLAIAASMWFLAEIVNSLAANKLRSVHLATALTASTYIRPDTILMAIALIPLSISIYQTKRQVFISILILILLTSIPISAWMVINVVIGRVPLSMHEGTGFYPDGYRTWVKTWAVNERERDDAMLGDQRYAKFQQSKFLAEVEAKEATDLIAKLQEKDGVVRSESVDAQFQKLANKKYSEYSISIKAELYWAKAYNLLLSPFSVWGLPVAVGYVDKTAILRAIGSFNAYKLDELLVNRKAAILIRLLAYTYQVLFFVSFFIIILLASIGWKRGIRKPFQPHASYGNFLVWTSASVMFSRLVFFVALGNLESRYLVEAIPWLECSLAFCIFSNRESLSDSRIPLCV
jgi:hypothetical protein